MTYKFINIDTINASMMGDDSMVKQFVQMYLMQMPIDFNNLESAIQSAIHSDIKDKAHHIKPTMQYIGASELQNDFQELETLGKENADLTLILTKFEAVKPKFKELIEELKSLV